MRAPKSHPLSTSIGSVVRSIGKINKRITAERDEHSSSRSGVNAWARIFISITLRNVDLVAMRILYGFVIGPEFWRSVPTARLSPLLRCPNRHVQL